MGKAIRTSALILLLACSVQAGWMANGVAEPPPPVEQETTSTVQEPTEGDTQGEATGSLTQTVLDLIAGVFSLV
ncbi:MAG TPA: hypothetical protein VEX70_14760 [Pyrinomonadaceae bacterium]|nr:hypothetical protein [Pyrinomonadaceae bacterium]